MTNSNTLYLAIRATPPLEGVGWEVRVLSCTDYTTAIAVVPEFTALVMGWELNAPGAGSITMDLDSPFWSMSLPSGDTASTLLDYEHLWECWEDGVLRFQFLGRNVEESIVSEDATRTVTVSGPGAADCLRWAKVLMPGNVAPNNLFWQFTDTPAMAAWLTLLEAAQARETITWVNPTFDDTNDSAGIAWADAGNPQATWIPDLGTDLLTLLNVCTGQDLDQPSTVRAEWIMWPGFELDVRGTIGSHLETEVIFYDVLTVQRQRTRTREEIANYVQVRDVYGAYSPAQSRLSIAAWGQREYFDQPSTVMDAARRDQIAQVRLAQRKDESSSWTVTVPYTSTGRTVFQDYDIGDWIGMANFNGATESTVDAYRVMAITVQITADRVEPQLELTLESLQEDRQKQLLRQVNSLVNNIGGPVSVPPITFVSYPTTALPIGYDPTSGTIKPMDDFPGWGGTGCRVFIQPTDPGEEANIGDFWYNTAYE